MHVVGENTVGDIKEAEWLGTVVVPDLEDLVVDTEVEVELVGRGANGSELVEPGDAALIGGEGDVVGEDCVGVVGQGVEAGGILVELVAGEGDDPLGDDWAALGVEELDDGLDGEGLADGEVLGD